MDPLSLRFRYLLMILVAAGVTAAALRHFAHVGAGFSVAQIRVGALTAAALVFGFLAVAFYRRKSKGKP